jgi:hypothetical protein
MASGNGVAVDEIGPVVASEESARLDARRFRVVSTIAGVVCAIFALTHLTFTAMVVPTFRDMFASMGGELPVATRVLLTLSGNGVLPALLLVVDAAVFALMYRLARRHWMGLLFVPIPIYMSITAVLVPVLYLPLYNITTLIQ